MNTQTPIQNRWTLERVCQLFARLRHRQLLTALAGDVQRSASYARRAMRVRQVAKCPSCN